MRIDMYVLVYRGLKGDESGIPCWGPQFGLVGPFLGGTGALANSARENASLWGRDWQTRNGDDPRWNTIELAPPGSEPEPVRGHTQNYALPVYTP